MKKINSIITIILLSAMLGGCMPSNVVDLDRPEVQGDNASTIIWWGLFESSENIKPIIDEFKKNNAGIDVQYIQKDQNTYFEDLKRVLSNSDPNDNPDIFMIKNSWVGNFESIVSPAPSSILSIDQYKSEYHSFIAEDFAHGGEVKGMPLWVDMLGLLYHKPYLEKSGSTAIDTDWNNFKVQAESMKSVKEGEEISTFSAANAENVEFSFEVANLLFLQARNSTFDESALAVPFKVEEKEKVSKAIDFYRSFKDGSTTWKDDNKKDTALFIEGKLATMISPSWRILDMLSISKERDLGIDIGVSEVPQLSADNKVNLAVYWGYVVSSESQKKDESWKLLKHLVDKGTQELYMSTQISNGRPFGVISPRKDITENQKEISYLKPYIDSIPYTHSWYMINGDKLKPAYAKLLDGTGKLDDVSAAFDTIKGEKDTL